MVFITTFLTIRAIQIVRIKARKAYQSSYKEFARQRNTEWLKARTLHVSGIPVEDRTGIGLVRFLEQLLSESSIGGKVLAIQIVPPFADIFNIEVKIRDLKDLNMLMINEDSKSYFCIPNKYKNLASFEQTLEAYEEELV